MRRVSYGFAGSLIALPSNALGQHHRTPRSSALAVPSPANPRPRVDGSAPLLSATASRGSPPIRVERAVVRVERPWSESKSAARVAGPGKPDVATRARSNDSDRAAAGGL